MADKEKRGGRVAVSPYVSWIWWLSPFPSSVWKQEAHAKAQRREGISLTYLAPLRLGVSPNPASRRHSRGRCVSRGDHAFDRIFPRPAAYVQELVFCAIASGDDKRHGEDRDHVQHFGPGLPNTCDIRARDDRGALLNGYLHRFMHEALVGQIQSSGYRLQAKH